MARSCVGIALVLTVAVAGPVRAQATAPQSPYPRMAPPSEYLIADRNAEIALARSAAPDSISNRAEVMVLGRNGYVTAAPGTNGFVCLVERSWDAAIGVPQFWNPKIRGPDCFNAGAVRSYLPIVLMKSRLALAGKSQAQIDNAIQAAFKRKEFPPIPVGAMCYMMSRQQFLNDQAKSWHPHLMFIVPLEMSKSWGADLPGSPIYSTDDAPDRLTIFVIPVSSWSDGTPYSAPGH